MQPIKLNWLSKKAIQQILGTARGQAVITLVESDKFPALYAAIMWLCKGDVPGFLVNLPAEYRTFLVDEVKRRASL